jgi:Flp pilus assembly protein TadB
MTEQPPPHDIKALWREQKTEGHPMSLAQIHARGFQSRIRRRNLVEYVASAIVVAAFSGYVVFLPSPILKLASAMIVVGTLLVVWQLHKRGSARSLPPGASGQSSLAFHRAELVRQRDALRTVWLWYLMPFAPGMVLFNAGLLLHQPGPPLTQRLPVPVVGAAVFLGIWLLNRRGAKRLQREIDDLDAIGE